MRPLRRRVALSDVVRPLVCLALLGLAGGAGGCAATPSERIFGFQAAATMGSAWLGDHRGRLSSAEEEAIITQAIVAHEMRKP